MTRWIAILLLHLAGLPAALADDHAVGLVYHHVSTVTPPSTSVTPEVFEAHLDYLEREAFNVWPLGRILDLLRRGEALPPNTVALTFDDAYLSVLTEAYPRLRRRGWTFTLFVNSEAVDRSFGQILSWSQIRKLAQAGVEIGNHSHSHAHLVRRRDGETEAAWRERVLDDITHAGRRLETETGIKPKLFAYPYGEHSPQLQALLESLDYIGISQQSGAIGADSDFLAIPRFPMSTGYANMQRFATSVHARPLPLTELTPIGLAPRDGQLEALEFTLGEGPFRRAQLACYNARGERLDLTPDSDDANRFRVALDYRQFPGRNKINCTAPAQKFDGDYFWYSHLWLVRKPDGNWYRE